MERVGQSQQVRITENYKKEILEQTDLARYNVTFIENSVTVTPKFQTRSFTGVNNIVFLGWGFDIYLNSTNANKLAAGYGLATVIPGLAPEPVVSKILSAGFSLGGAAVSWHNAAGRGVILTASLTGGILWIRSQ